MLVFSTSISFLVRKVDLVGTSTRSKVKKVNGEKKTLKEKPEFLRKTSFQQNYLNFFVVIQT